MIPRGDGGGVGSKTFDALCRGGGLCMMLAHAIFDETLLEIGLPSFSVSDLVLDHVYNGLICGIADRVNVGGGVPILKM